MTKPTPENYRWWHFLRYRKYRNPGLRMAFSSGSYQGPGHWVVKERWLFTFLGEDLRWTVLAVVAVAALILGVVK